MARAYFNEIDPYAAQWLRNLIAAGHIADGDVDERSIVDVRPDDLAGYTQCHFFAGIGGWSYAARLAGWPDECPLWTGSCPCQPFSVAGKQAGQADARHLWPEFFRLIANLRPRVVMGEQVAAAVGKNWLDGVHSDLEGIDYACRAAIVPACAVDAPHRRDRLWFVADAANGGCGEEYQNAGRRDERDNPEGFSAGHVASRAYSHVDDAFGSGLEGHAGHGGFRDEPGRVNPLATGPVATAGSSISDAYQSGAGTERPERSREFGGAGRNSTHWSGTAWAVGADGKARRFKPGIRLLSHGVPARMGKLRAYGNAIVPAVAAEVIGAYLDAEREVISQ